MVKHLVENGIDSISVNADKAAEIAEKSAMGSFRIELPLTGKVYRMWVQTSIMSEYAGLVLSTLG